ncbi:MAG: hypothetical protein IJ438_10550 [Clostridia bacterium]|nr:hypothetical protein [Clostridia bacterium]
MTLQELCALAPWLCCHQAAEDDTLRGYQQVCRQCTAEEVLLVLTRCTAVPTPDALALLIGAHRREQAQRLYALQLLWRLLGDGDIPDAVSLFGQDAPAPSGEAIAGRLLDQLKGDAP